MDSTCSGIDATAPDPESQGAAIVLFQPRVGYMDSMRSKPALPLSLLHAASLAAQHYSVQIIDQRVHEDWRARLQDAMQSSPVLLGLTCYTGPMISSALEAATVARKANPETTIVWGGVHVGLQPELSAAHPLVDIVVRGEGEVTLLELARALSKGMDLRKVPGITFEQSNGRESTDSPPFLDLSAAPEIPYHLVNIDDYMPLYEGRKSLYMESSRGCPFACTYCYNVYFNKRRWRAQSPERVLERVQYVRDRYGAQDIYFTDDDFFIHPKRSRAIVEGLLGIDVTWQVQGSDIVCVSKMSDDFLRLLRDSGFRRFTVGIETGSPRMRQLMNKEGSVALIEETLERLARFGFIVYGSFISNTPGETLEDIRLSVSLIERLHDLNANFRNSPFYRYTPFPGTPMFEHAVEEGFRPPENLQDWADFSYEKNAYYHEESQSPEFYERLYVTALLNDHKVDEYTVPWWIRAGAALYRPLARARLRHLYFDWMPEMGVARRILRGT
jgi:radical SAM superfamily enzyme YgiQ (UPF0313 family)